MTRTGLVLLALGPVLAAAYAAVNHAAIRTAAKAQVDGPGWEGGRVGADGLTSLGVYAWRVVGWTALLVGVVAVAGLYDAADFAAGVPSWQPATAFLIAAAGVAQTAGLVLAAREGRRAAGATTSPSPRSRPAPAEAPETQAGRCAEPPAGRR